MKTLFSKTVVRNKTIILVNWSFKWSKVRCIRQQQYVTVHLPNNTKDSVVSSVRDAPHKPYIAELPFQAVVVPRTRPLAKVSRTSTLEVIRRHPSPHVLSETLYRGTSLRTDEEYVRLHSKPLRTSLGIRLVFHEKSVKSCNIRYSHFHLS